MNLVQLFAQALGSQGSPPQPASGVDWNAVSAIGTIVGGIAALFAVIFVVRQLVEMKRATVEVVAASF